MTRAILTSVALLLALTGATAAQDAGGRAREGAPDALTAGAAQRLFDLLLLDEAEKTLTLSARQYPDFVTRLRALQDTRRTNQQQRLRLMAELQRMTGPRAAPADASALTDRLRTLKELDSRSAAELHESVVGVDVELTPEEVRWLDLEEEDA